MSTDFLMDNFCFACGAKNTNGLRLQIIESGDGVKALIKMPSWAQGYHKIVHGGIVATILDELAVWAAFKKGYKAVTVGLNVRIKNAMNIDDDYVAQARVIDVKHGLVKALSEIKTTDHRLIAHAEVKLMKSQ